MTSPSPQSTHTGKNDSASYQGYFQSTHRNFRSFKVGGFIYLFIEEGG